MQVRRPSFIEAELVGLELLRNVVSELNTTSSGSPPLSRKIVRALATLSTFLVMPHSSRERVGRAQLSVLIIRMSVAALNPSFETSELCIIIYFLAGRCLPDLLVLVN